MALPVKDSPQTKRFEAIIDSGATMCQFQADLGRAIGLDLENGEKSQTMGIAGPSPIFVQTISLYLPGGVVEAKVGFSDSLPVSGLLGMNGFFEHFKITFDPFAQRCVLERLLRA